MDQNGGTIKHTLNQRMTSMVTIPLLSTWQNNISNNEMGLDDPSGINRIPALVFSGILFVIGTVGNLHALIIYVQKYRRQKAMTMATHRENPYVVFVLSLAVLDMCICVLILPLDIIDTCTQFTLLPEIGCKIFRYCQTLLSISSILHVVIISIHCWRRICYPHKRQVDSSLAIKLCIGCNVLATLSSTPSLILSGFYTKIVNGMSGPVCFVSDTYNGTIWATTYMGSIAVLFAVCLFIICTSYVALNRFRWLRNQRKFASGSTKNKEKAEKTTATLIILTVIFTISYIPFMVIGLIAVANKDFRKGWNVATLATYRVFARFPHLNNILNPFIYGCRDPEFNKRLGQMYAPLYQKCQKESY